MTEWMPIQIALPLISNRYLVSDGYGIDIEFFDYDEKIWKDNEGNIVKDNCYWVELPELPKVKHVDKE